MCVTDGETEAQKAKLVTPLGFATHTKQEKQPSNVTTVSNADHCSAVIFDSSFYISSAHQQHARLPPNNQRFG